MPWPERERSNRPRVEAGPALVVAGAGVLLILAALTFDAAPLFVPGIGFLLLAALAVAWVTGCARYAVLCRELAASRVVEDEPLEAVIDVRRGHLGLPGARINDPLAGTSVLVDEPLAWLSGATHVQLRVVARVHRRGRHTFAPPALNLSDSLGLVRVTRAGTGEPDELLVLPATEPIRWLRPAHRRLARGQAARATQEPMGAGEIDGLRQYMPGTPASRIHWPAVARGAGLLERRLVSELEAHPLVVLDARVDLDSRAPGVGEARLDAAVRAAASLILALARGGGCSTLLPGERVPTMVGPDLAAWPDIHARLALVEAEPGHRHGPALRAAVAGGSLTYVAARLDSAAPAAGPRRGQQVLVLPLELGSALDLVPSFEVSGCGGYMLGSRRRATGVAAA
jgi:uncharacterized protein (DUF58 family)